MSADERRLSDVYEAASQAFWDTVSDLYPEAKTGDIDPTVVSVFEVAADATLRHWVETNVPEPPDDGGMPLERAQLIMWVLEALPTGFVLDTKVCTGGNCYAMVVTAPGGRTLYLTDGDSSLPFSCEEWGVNGAREYRGLLLGYYDARDEEAGWVTIDAEDVNERNVKVSVEAWAEGDPYHDKESSRINH